MITFTPDPAFDQAVRTAWVLFTDRDPDVLGQMLRALVRTHPQLMATCPACFGTTHLPPVGRRHCQVCILGVVHATTATLAWDGAPKHPNYGNPFTNPNGDHNA